MPFDEASSELLEGIRVKAGCILDVGTGSGKAAFMALKVMGDAGCVIGVDVSKRMVERAHLRRVEEDLHSIAFLRGCGEHLPFRDEVFGAVFSNFGLAHFRDPVASLDEMTRVLEKGGRTGVADHRHPIHIDVHPLFKEVQPKTVVDWISGKLRGLGCRTTSAPFLRRNFYVVIGRR